MIFRCFYLLFLFCRYNCFFLLGLSTGFICAPFRKIYKKDSISQAKRLVSFLQAAGPSFIKLGQILSIRVDIFSNEYIKELSNLQDKVKPISEKKMKAFIYKLLGNKLNTKIKIYSYTPIACGSVSQVYKGEIVSCGSKVAIKVIKPNMVNIIKKDLKIINIIFSFFEKYTEAGQITKPTKLVKVLKQVTYFELDLRYEAASCDQIKDNSKEDEYILIPKIYWDFVSLNVLVQQWVDGISILDLEELKRNNIQLDILSKNFVRAFFIQVFKYGFFHGDLHPGNVYVTKDGKLVFIDFGIMGKLSPILRMYLRDLTIAFLHKNYYKAAKIHFDLGWVKPPNQVADFALACRSIMEININLEQQEVDIGGLLQQLFRIAKNFGMEVQEDLLILQKSMIYLESTSRHLSPNNNVWIMSKEVLEKYMKDVREKHHIKQQAKLQVHKSVLQINEYIDHLMLKFHSYSNKSHDNYSTKILFLLLGLFLGLGLFLVSGN